MVILNHNYGHFLGPCIQSALEQTLSPIEIIVIDDGSTDGSWKLLEDWTHRHSKILRAIRTERSGQAAALNLGIASSRGEWVAFLDADDYWFPRKLETTRREIHDQDVVCIQHYLEIRREPPKENQREGIYPEILPPVITLRDYFRSGNTDFFTATSGLTIRRSVLNRIAPLDESWKICADVVLTRPLPIFGKVLTLSDPLGVYRVHGANQWYGTEARTHYVENYLSRIQAANDALKRFGVQGRIRPERNLNYLAERFVRGPIRRCLKRLQKV